MRRAFAWLALVAFCALTAVPVTAQQIAFVPRAGATTFVAIAPIARQLGWSFKRTFDGAILDDGTGPQALRVGSTMVRDDGVDLPLFDQPVADRNGSIELALSDAATLFHLQVQKSGTSISLVTELASDVTISEVPRPATPPPAPVASPHPQVFATPALVSGNAGTVAVSVLFDGNTRTYQSNLSGNAGLVRGSVSSMGTDALSAPAGIVTVGSAAHDISFGSIENPLAGSIINNGALVGVDAHLAHGTTQWDAYSGHTYTGSLVAIERAHGDVTDTLAEVANGGVNQPLWHHAVVAPQSWGTVEADTLAGTRGAGAGIRARTKGKVFIDAIASEAHGTLPLSDGDLATGAVVGDHLSSATTVTAGYLRAMGAPGSPTLGITTQIAHVNLGASVSEHWTNLSASFGGSSAYGSLFASTGAQRVFGANVGVAFHKALAEMNVTGSGGSTDGVLQLRTNHPGVNLAAGFDLNAGVVRPLIGLVLPVTSSLAFEAGLVAGPSGRPALRISMLAGIRAPKPRVAMFPVSVFVPDATHYGPLKVFVDGAPVATPFAAGGQVNVPAGHHTLYVESADRAYASLPQDVVAASPAKVSMTLFPQRAIAGRISFGGSPDAVPAGASLDGIRVVLEPSGESATTDADGRFVFARGAYDPASTILLDPATLPAGYLAPPATPIAPGDTVLALPPARAIERVSVR